MHEASMGNEGNTGLGVMGQPNGAVRDPLFFRWHKVKFDVLFIFAQEIWVKGNNRGEGVCVHPGDPVPTFNWVFNINTAK